MKIKLTDDIHFIDKTFAKGTIGVVLSKSQANKIKDRKVLGRLKVMADKYRTRGFDGVFALLGNSWRWVDKRDYEKMDVFE